MARSGRAGIRREQYVDLENDPVKGPALDWNDLRVEPVFTQKGVTTVEVHPSNIMPVLLNRLLQLPALINSFSSQPLQCCAAADRPVPVVQLQQKK